MPVDGSSLTTSWSGSDVRRRAGRTRAGAVLEHEPQLGLGDRQPLPGADEERDARPAPVLDVEAQRRVGLGGRVGGDAVDRAVALVLAADVVRGVGGDAPLGTPPVCASLRVAGSPPAGASIAAAADHLHEVVDHDVAQRADRVVEVAAVLDAEVLGHGDLHALRRSSGSRPARASCSRSGGRGSPRAPSSRGSGRCGGAVTRRCTGAVPRRAPAPTARSCPNGFSTTTRACLVSPALASPFTTVANRNGGISR